MRQIFKVFGFSHLKPKISIGKKVIMIIGQYLTILAIVINTIFMIFTAMTQWWENGGIIPIMINTLYKMIRDPDPLVITNSIEALKEILAN